MPEMKAYLKADALEDPEIIDDLRLRLSKQEITLFITSQDWINIKEEKPFLYYRNPFIRFPQEKEILQLHWKNENIFVIKNYTEEILSVNPRATNKLYSRLEIPVSYQAPKYLPLPIMVGTHNRPDYLQLTLNSLKYATKNIVNQRFYLVGSDIDEKTREVIDSFLKSTPLAEAVVSPSNLSLTLFNFGSRFFGLKQFIHFEDDGILPESTAYQLPFWTQQLAYRANKTADLVGFRVSEDNQKTWLLQQLQQEKDETRLSFIDRQIWHYFTPKKTDLPPISGNGLVIDTEKHYKNSPFYQTDLGMYQLAKTVCIINIPIYHIGANQVMDYSNLDPLPKKVAQYYWGRNFKTGEDKLIDLLD